MPKDFEQYSEPKRVAIYTRFSSTLQRETSTEDQIRECREAAQEKGWTVLDEFIRSDEARSGQSLEDRDGLDDLMTLVQQKDCPFDGIIVHDTSRLNRNLTDGLQLIDILKYCKVFLYFKTRRLDSRDPNFRTIFIQLASKDEEYCVDTGERVHRGQRGRVLNGFVASGRAYGYRNVPIPSTTARWKHGRSAIEGVKREIIPEQAAIVLRIFEMYAAGLGQKAIALKLNEEGIPSSGKLLGSPNSRWSTTTVAQLLRDTKFIGLYIWNKTHVVWNPITRRKESHKRPESEWERTEIPEWRIISDDLWNAVQNECQIRQGNYGRKKGGLNRSEASRKYIFSGLLSCDKCGLPLIAIRTGKDGDVRYACDGGRIGRCPGTKSIMLTLLEAQLLDTISGIVRDPSVREKLAGDYYGQVVSFWNERTKAVARVTENIEELRDRRQDLRRKASNIVDSLQDDGRNPLLVQRLKAIQGELANLDATIAAPAEVIPPMPSQEQVEEVITRKLAGLQAALTGEPEVLKQRLSKHIDKLTMKLVEMPDGPRYEVTGDVRLFPPNDPDDVLLAASFQRTCKQYIPLSFPLKASLIVRAGEWEKQTKSAATRKKIGDANRMRWAERKRAKAAKAA